MALSHLARRRRRASSGGGGGGGGYGAPATFFNNGASSAYIRARTGDPLKGVPARRAVFEAQIKAPSWGAANAYGAIFGAVASATSIGCLYYQVNAGGTAAALTLYQDATGSRLTSSPLGVNLPAPGSWLTIKLEVSSDDAGPLLSFNGVLQTVPAWESRAAGTDYAGLTSLTLGAELLNTGATLPPNTDIGFLDAKLLNAAGTVLQTMRFEGAAAAVNAEAAYATGRRVGTFV